jgi:hypothetical protein
VALLSFITVAYAAGWDLVIVRNFPDFAVAGMPLNLAFKVWVPSEEPLRGLHPIVRATNTKGREVRTGGKEGTVGEFTATLILPDPGDWVIALDTEYKNAATLPPLKVIAPGDTVPHPLPLATRGARLYAMPNLDLANDEIDALTAFLTRKRSTATALLPTVPEQQN